MKRDDFPIVICGFQRGNRAWTFGLGMSYTPRYLHPTFSSSYPEHIIELNIFSTNAKEMFNFYSKSWVWDWIFQITPRLQLLVQKRKLVVTISSICNNWAWEDQSNTIFHMAEGGLKPERRRNSCRPARIARDVSGLTSWSRSGFTERATSQLTAPEPTPPLHRAHPCGIT